MELRNDSANSVSKTRLQNIENKKIIIYGTGKTAECLLGQLPRNQIIGIIDKTKFSGEKCGVPILQWDNLQRGDADIIIIAALQRYYKEIYQRIIEKCIAFGILIYGAKGEDLIRHFGLGINPYQNFRYYEKTADELFHMIERYDVVSFDIFDTLVMRKVLEPADLFDIVEARLNLSELLSESFKAVRRQAELLAKGQNIYVIYDILQENTGISDAWKERILATELNCEKSLIVGRMPIIEIFHKAVASGKKVYLVSDMYLTGDLLAELLKEVGVEGFERIYVSCEYGVSKGNGLFQKLCDELGDRRCIHIGDNEEVDIKAAKKCGLAAYRVNSAAMMLHNSNLSYALGFATCTNDKNLIGLMIADLFHDPFFLYGTSGVLRLSSLRQTGVVMLGTLAVEYLALIFDKITRENYDGILFAARDEYFFKCVYDRLSEFMSYKVPSFYVYSSRKLVIRSGMDTAGEIDRTLAYMSGEKERKQLLEMFGIEAERGTVDRAVYGSGESDEVREQIAIHSCSTRKGYRKYLESLGIDLKRKYLLCEMDGKGTSHYYLNRLFEQELDSLYITRHHFADSFYQLSSEALYDFWDAEYEYNCINDNVALIESVFSAPHPSVEDMGEGGEPVFEREVRSREQIGTMLKMQEAIGEFCEEYFKNLHIGSSSLNRELPIHFLELFPYIRFEGESRALYQGRLYDEISRSYFNMATEE